MVSYHVLFPVDAIAIAEKVNVHEADGSSFPVTGELSLGERLVTLDERKNWLKVKADRDRMGWVEKSAIYQFAR